MKNNNEMSADRVQEDIHAYRANRTYIEENVIFCLVNYEYNADALKERPHKRIFDMAIIYECVILKKEGKLVTLPISNYVLEQFGFTLKEVDRWSVKNTQRIQKPSFQILPQVMKELIMQSQDEVSDYFKDSIFGNCGDEFHEDEKNLTLYVLTNESRIRGAACIIYEDYLAGIARKLNCDLYICPSSIHETILIPKTDSIDPRDLREIIREVNSELVIDEEILSNELYFYSLNKNELELCKAG